MFVSKINNNNNIKRGCRVGLLPYKNLQCKNLNNNQQTDSVSFSGSVGKYLNREIFQQNLALKKELTALFLSDEPFAPKFESIVRDIFPDFKFKLKDTKQIKHPDIKSQKPIIFAENDFSPEGPTTILYLNSEKLNNRRNIINPKPHIDEISKTIAENNELNFVSKLADELAEKLDKAENINPETTNQHIQEILNKYHLDINFSIVDKNTLSPNSHGAMVSPTLKRNEQLHCIIDINFNLRKKRLRQDITHEFVHILNANSVKYNLHKAIPQSQKSLCDIFSQGFHKVDKNMRFYDLPLFFKLPMQIKGIFYSKILKKIFEGMTQSEAKIQLPSVIKYASDEAFAYSKTPGRWSEDFKNYLVPYGYYYKDFLNYAISVENDSKKFQKLFG